MNRASRWTSSTGYGLPLWDFAAEANLLVFSWCHAQAAACLPRYLSPTYPAWPHEIRARGRVHPLNAQRTRWKISATTTTTYSSSHPPSPFIPYLLSSLYPYPHSNSTTMSQNQDISGRTNTDVAPTPQNTPLDTAVLANRPANIGRPKVEDIGEGDDEEEGGEDVGGMNPASLLAQVSHNSRLLNE